jgi:GTP-binding protein HflX
LRQEIITFFESGMVESELHIPYVRSEVLGEIRRNLRVLTESYDEHGTLVRVRGHHATISKIGELLSAAQPGKA